MRRLFLAGLLAGGCFAQITNVRVLGTTATQSAIAYTAPDGSACSVAVSTTADGSGNPLAPLVHDTDTALFPGSDQDSRAGDVSTGRARIIVIGKRDAETASDGRYYSRALQANTTHYGRITCGTGNALFTFQTTNIPLGVGFSDPWPTDASVPGAWAAPSSPGSVANEQFIDPQTGVRVQRVTYPGQGYNAPQNVAFGTAYDQGQNPCDAAGPWTSPCNATGSSGYASVGNSTGWLVIRPSNQSFGYGGTDPSYGYSLNQVRLSLTGHATQAGEQLDVCISMNAGASCASQIQTVPVPSGTDGTITAGSYNPGAMGIDPWVFNSDPRINRPEASTAQGNVTVTGATVKLNSGTFFSSYWTSGGQGRIRLSGLSTADACNTASGTSIEATIANGFGNTLTLTAAPGGGPYSYYCAPDFAIMVRRHAADGGSVLLKQASFSYVSSEPGEQSDTGFNNICSVNQVNGGFLCMVGLGAGWGGLAWIDPVAGTSNIIGPLTVNGKSSGTDTWAQYACPLMSPLPFVTIDDTKSTPTWYCLSNSNGKPIVLQVVYTGTYSSSQPFSDSSPIGLGSPLSSDNYSITFTNATITDLTPASLGHDLISMIGAFTGQTMDSGMNCYNGPVQQGNMLIYCYRAQNTLTWFAVFSPGDGVPAHAGQPGGPNIIAAMNSWGSGTARWSVDHSTEDYGHSGYFGYNASTITPGSQSVGNTAVIVTTNSVIPSTGSDCSQWGNPMGVSGTNCTLIAINVNNGSYEPYYWTPVPPQGQTPGELSTAQNGDIWCISASQTSCNWVNGSAEVLVLIQKGANGQWVFQRNAAAWPFGPRGITGNGVKYLFAMSGATALGLQDAGYPTYYGMSWGGNIYWDYRNDPHGQSTVKDPEYFDAHGAFRPTIGVESGSYPFSPYGGVYKVRHAGSFLQLFAAPISYIAANPSFAGAYGAAVNNVWQSHASVSGDLAGPYEGQTAFDVRPLIGIFSSTPSPPDLWTLVSGQLWKTTYTVTDADNIGSLNRKLLPTAASSGSHPLLDVSGPGSSISNTAAASYQYCIPRSAGECWPGSVVGEVYVNAPGVVYPYCYGNSAAGQSSPANDICISNMPAVGLGLVQFSTLQPDASGQLQRVLVKAMNGKVKLTNGLAGTLLLPDNSWTTFSVNYLDSARRELYMAKVPPFPAGDSVTRSAFVPVPLTLKPPAGLKASNAIVEFGYQEFNGNCTTRQETCIASASTPGAVPFQFAGENPAGAPCATQCTITIPAASQRVLYYRVKYRDSSNNIVSLTPRQVFVIP